MYLISLLLFPSSPPCLYFCVPLLPSFLPSFLSSFLPFFLSSFLPFFLSSFLPFFLPFLSCSSFLLLSLLYCLLSSFLFLFSSFFSLPLVPFFLPSFFFVFFTSLRLFFLSFPKQTGVIASKKNDAYLHESQSFVDREVQAFETNEFRMNKFHR